MIRGLIALAALWPAVATAAERGETAFAAGRYEAAAAIWRSAAEAGDAEAALALGNAYDIGRGVAADASRACFWYGRAGEAGLASAEFNMGVMRDTGRCGSRDPASAALWYGRAAARGHARAQYALAQLYAAGDGVPQSQREARAWFSAALRSGISAAADAAVRPVRARGSLTAAIPAWPVARVLPAPNSASAGPVEVALVWTTDELPEAARFYVEVFAIHPGSPELTHSAPALRTATVVSLPPGAYAWRVLTADGTAGHYASSSWATFDIVGRVVGTP